MDLERSIKKNNALALIYLAYTGRELRIQDTQDVSLEIDLSLEGDRMFLQKLSGIKLPEIFYLKVINFYECDEEVENLLQNQITSIQMLHLAAEGYMVDINDYLSTILELSCLHTLYLDGFLIDSESIEKLLLHPQIQVLSYFSWNLGIDDDFSIKDDDISNLDESTPESCTFLLKYLGFATLRFILDDTSPEDMARFIQSISGSRIKTSLKEIAFLGCRVSRSHL